MADGPVAAMAVTHAGRPRTNLKILSGPIARLGVTTTYHQSRPADDAASEIVYPSKCWGNTLYLVIDGGYQC